MYMNDISTSLNKWDLRYLNLAANVATWSKDPSTKIGAIAIGKKGQVLAQGYNGFPRGIEDTPTRYSIKKQKYKLVVHAEMNVIYNATYNGISLDGSTLYVNGLPVCSDCAKGIIQVGVKKVVMKDTEIPKQWIESWEETKGMFNEAGIEWYFINTNTGKARGLYEEEIS